jgi:beta-xylosidase
VRALHLSLLVAFLATSYWSYLGTHTSESEQPGRLRLLHEDIAARLGTSPAAFYDRPVLAQNFPDPAVIEADGAFYAYATNSNQSNIGIARSTDLLEWTVLPDALPDPAPWVQPLRNLVWAPEVIKMGAEYKMYYTAHDRASRRQCVGVATSATPLGPFLDIATSPLLCPDGFERAIDAHPYLDGGRLYLYFSGVCCGTANGIYVQQLTADGLRLTGAPSLLLSADVPWEGTVAEAPTIIKRGLKYYLFYSGNDYRNETYAMGYAVCESPIGPCLEAVENPILATGSSTSPAIGPGHQSIVKVGPDYWVIYHGWDGAVGYRNGGRRAMWLAPLTWREGRPTVGTPVRAGR